MADPSKQPVDFEFFLKVTRGLIKILATVAAEKGALEMALLESQQLPYERYCVFREKYLKDLEPSLRAFQEADADALLKLLRDFQGPIQ